MNTITKWIFLTILLGQSLVFAGPLHDAAAEGNLVEVERLLDGGEAHIEDIDGEGATALISVLSITDPYYPDVVKLLIARGANVNAKDNDGFTPLMFAAMEGRTDSMILLLEAGANINAQNDDGGTALYKADILMYKASNEFEVAFASQPFADKIDRFGRIQDETDPFLFRAPTPQEVPVPNREIGKRMHKELIECIRKWSIENQVLVTNAEDIKRLDGDDRGSYNRDFAAYSAGLKQVREAMKRSDLSRIPRPHPTSIIEEYLGIPEETQPEQPQSQKCPFCGY